MSTNNQLIIDLDHLSDDPEALAKLHECASLMVQSNNRQEVETGYRMLELVDRVMHKPAKPALKE